MSWRTLYKLALGFSLGFVGAFVTIQAIDRFGPSPEAEPLEVVLGAPDFDAFCTRDLDLAAVSTSGEPDGWVCAGLVGGLWTTRPVDVQEVCRWNYGTAASERLVDASVPDGWVCVTDP